MTAELADLAVARRFCDFAREMRDVIPDSAYKVTMLRLLGQARDSAIRAIVSANSIPKADAAASLCKHCKAGRPVMWTTGRDDVVHIFDNPVFSDREMAPRQQVLCDASAVWVMMTP